MSQDGGPGRQNQDRNGSPGSNLLLWALLIVVSGLLLIFWVSPFFTRDLKPDDLKRLVAASPRVETGGKLKEGFAGYIDVRDDKDKLYRFSDLRQVVIHDRSVSGKVGVVEIVQQGKQLVPIDKTYNATASFRTNIDPNGQYREDIINLLAENKIDFRFASGPTSFDQHGPWIVFGIVAIFLVYFMLRRLIGAGSPMSFGRSRGRLYAQEDLGVTFYDVAGIDEAVEEVREVVDFL